MSDRREEIAFELELLDMEEKFLAAKASGNRRHPDRVRFSETRTWLRQIRDGVVPTVSKSED